LSHSKHHHAKGRPVAGDRKRRAVFLALLSVAIIFLFIVLPFWLLFKRSIAPPSPESFGPAAPTGIPKPATEPEDEPADSDKDNDEPIKFK
jgi:hypothetical protein